MVELFAANIRQIAPRADSLVSKLDDERRARVRSLGNSDEALRSLAGGLLIRHVFGARQPFGLRFLRGERGKPALPNERPFNLTHAGDYAVLALSEHSVGVDLERIRAIDWLSVSSRFFHPLECDFLSNSADPQTDFFRIWTLKESYLKAEGTGFSISPATFGILPKGESGARLNTPSLYRFRRYADFSGYCCSVCCLEDDIASSIRMLEF